MEGYITSAGAGSESLVQATRAAFAAYTERTERELGTIDGVSLTTTVMVRISSHLFLPHCQLAWLSNTFPGPMSLF
jgi:hypothetical protein